MQKNGIEDERNHIFNMVLADKFDPRNYTRNSCSWRSILDQTKIPPLFDGSTSWFKYEELTEDWLDLTVLEETKRGPALRNRLVGDAEMYRGLPNQEPLIAERRWSQVFQGYF